MLSDNEGWAVGKAFIYLVIGLFALAFIVLFWVWAVRPSLMDAEREGNIRSHGYVEARRTEILNNIEECRRIDVDLARARVAGEGSVVSTLESQKQALSARVRRALSEIPVDDRSIDPSPCN
jgi:hypothetical protein